MSQSEIVVEGRNLTIGYQVGKKRTEVHSRLNFQLFRGELTCLLGANGAGKSTLLRTLAAAQPFLSGDLKLLGRDLSAYSERELSRTIGVVLTDRTQAGGSSEEYWSMDESLNQPSSVKDEGPTDCKLLL